MFEEIRHQQRISYDDAIIPSVAVKKMNDIYKPLKIKCPNEIPFSIDTTSVEMYSQFFIGNYGLTCSTTFLQSRPS